MLDFGRTLYRVVAPVIDPTALCPGGDPDRYVRQTIEQAANRLATDRACYRAPARTLFEDIRWCFPLARQPRVAAAVNSWVTAVDATLQALARDGHDATGNQLRCPVFTRRGTPCERTPLPRNGYCPSHQHLVEDGLEAVQAA